MRGVIPCPAQKGQAMKIIFLDFDGVLVTRRSLRRRSPEDRKTLDEVAAIAHKGDPACVGELNRVCAATGARIVVSSSWRKVGAHLNSLEYVKDVLRVWGVTAEAVGVTPQLERPVCFVDAGGNKRTIYQSALRGTEIQEWLTANVEPPVTNFAIVDDESDMCHLLPRLVQTEFEEGLTPAHADRLIQMLGENLFTATS